MMLFRAALVGALLLSAACGGNGEDDEANAPAAAIDTTNEDLMDGTSTQQVQAEAKAMSPEEAARAGLVDTTIHLENLSSSDSTPPGATLPGAPNPGAPAAARGDTVAPLPETNPNARPPARP
jgi:hypothetical protein